MCSLYTILRFIYNIIMFLYYNILLYYNNIIFILYLMFHVHRITNLNLKVYLHASQPIGSQTVIV